ncbi:MAG: preprotein translocase subunit YajC [Sphaerochaeta sp.]|jgi:preprotein translocase subunit YajC|nr:preprotein translocase subunit YajC [Sphaerochaeta sp.]MDX9915015.1 preprotein translocase subunit YajC [Sphaerochaeta sp.]
MFSLLSAMAAPEAGGGSGGSMTTTFVTFGLIIAIFYFLIIRPQRKRDKETKEMLAAIKKGDKVVSIGGIHGTVMVVKESSVIVKVDDNTRLEFSRNAINSIVKPKSEAAPAPAAKKREKKAVEAKKEEAVVEAKTETEPETKEEQ